MQHRKNTNFVRVQPSLATLSIGILLLVMSAASTGSAQQQGAKTFSSAQAAIQALFTAVQNDDEHGVREILGSDSELLSSQDESQDKREREQFVRKYQEMHRLVRELDGTMFLYIGAENWPFPVPLVSRAGEWYFDADAGKQEIVFRQVGENERTAIETCRALVSAGKEGQAATVGDDSIDQYAQRLLSVSHDTGNGGLAGRQESSNSFHGYYFQPVKEGHISDPKEKAIAFVAYPAEYRSSGVMTFIVDQKGVVYEKDLGTNTQKLVGKIRATQPSRGWHEAELP